MNPEIPHFLIKMIPVEQYEKYVLPELLDLAEVQSLKSYSCGNLP
jgi:hypothetical protein